jgi:thioesterase domain-containing protein
MFEGTLRALGIPMLKDRQAEPVAGPQPTLAGMTSQDSSGTPQFSRAPGLLPPPPSWDAYARTPPPPRERQGGADIFIGGYLDDLWPGDGVMHDYASRYQKQTGRPTQYFRNDRVGQVVDAIRQADASGGPANVVGHSFGGPDAYNAAAAALRQGLPVANVITLDPVSGHDGAVNGALSGAHWLNVQATTDHPNFSDLITHVPLLSAKPSNLPTRYADQTATVPAHHEDVAPMMRASGARAPLDRSRQIPDLNDSLTTSEWIRRRNAATSAGRTRP